jgi:hypothetical protein
MTISRRRFKQTVPLADRLQTFAQDLRREALSLPFGVERDALLKRAHQADTATHLKRRLLQLYSPAAFKTSVANLTRA